MDENKNRVHQNLSNETKAALKVSLIVFLKRKAKNQWSENQIVMLEKGLCSKIRESGENETNSE